MGLRAIYSEMTAKQSYGPSYEPRPLADPFVGAVKLDSPTQRVRSGRRRDDRYCDRQCPACTDHFMGRRIAKVTRRLFPAQPMPDLQAPRTDTRLRQAPCTCWAEDSPSRFAAHGLMSKTIWMSAAMTYLPGVSTWSCERILSPQRRQTISAPAIVVSRPSCSTMYCGAS